MIHSSQTKERIESTLRAELQPLKLEVLDQSHLHAGHKAAGGGGHFFVHVQSARFNGLSLIQRQRLVISLMGTMMDKEIHALSMKCEPTEA